MTSSATQVVTEDQLFPNVLSLHRGLELTFRLSWILLSWIAGDRRPNSRAPGLRAMGAAQGKKKVCEDAGWGWVGVVVYCFQLGTCHSQEN